MGILAKTNGAALVAIMAIAGCSDTADDAATPGEAVTDRTASERPGSYDSARDPDTAPAPGDRPMGDAAASQTNEGTQRGDPTTVSTPIIDGDGNEVGTLIIESEQQGVRLAMKVDGLAPGPHAVHFHEHGRCDPPEFESAGGHYNPAGARHGRPNTNGDPEDQEHHVGDMLNQDADAHGILNTVMINYTATLEDGPATLLDEDGSALIIHEGPDDYESQPAGDAGGRVACAVITRAQAQGAS